jgi:hypothetical protein
MKPERFITVLKIQLVYPTLSKMNQVYRFELCFPPISNKESPDNTTLKLIPIMFSHPLVLNSS